MSTYNRGPIQRQVEEEEGQPFWDVVRDYAEMGYSRMDTAIILGYGTPRNFIRLLRRHPEQKIDWPAQGKSVACRYDTERRRLPGSVENDRQRRAGMCNAKKSSHRYWVDGIYDTARNHYDRIKPDVSFKSIKWRLRHWGPHKAFYTPKIDAKDSWRYGREVRRFRGEKRAA